MREGRGEAMKINIEGSQKEIAALALAVQGRRLGDGSIRLRGQVFGQIAVEAIRDRCANKVKISMLKHRPTGE